MQKFRNEPSLKHYYHIQYNFVNPTEMENNETQDNQSISMSVNKIQERGIDWSPNRNRYRGHRRKQDRKRIIESSTWILPPS